MDQHAATQLAKTVTNPTRLDMLTQVRNGTKLNPRQYAEASGKSPGDSFYHAAVLKEAGIIRIDPTGPRKAPIRPFYVLGGPNADAAVALADFLANL